MAVGLPPITRLAAERAEKRESPLGAGLGCIETDGLKGTTGWRTKGGAPIGGEGVARLPGMKFL